AGGPRSLPAGRLQAPAAHDRGRAADRRLGDEGIGVEGPVARGSAAGVAIASEGAVQPSHAEGHAAAVQYQPARQGATRYRPGAHGAGPHGEGAGEVMSEANKRQLTGRVVSDRMAKTVTVRVDR